MTYQDSGHRFILMHSKCRYIEECLGYPGLHIIQMPNPKGIESAQLIYKNILKYFGYIKKGADTIEQLIVADNSGGKRQRGRSPTRLLDQIKSIGVLTFSEAMVG